MTPSSEDILQMCTTKLVILKTEFHRPKSVIEMMITAVDEAFS
jgi:hypothetical protein